MIKFDGIVQHINRNGYTHAKVYTGHADPKGKRALEFIKENNPEDLISRIKEYQDKHHGKYTLYLGETFGAINKSPRVLKVHFTDVADVEILGSEQMHTPKSLQALESEIESRILDRLERQAEEKRQADYIVELEEKVKYYETGSGKLAKVVSDTLVQLFMGGNNPMQQPAPGTPLQGVQDEQITREQLNEALGILVRELGPETIIKLSQKMNPSLVQMVKNFANN